MKKFGFYALKLSVAVVFIFVLQTFVSGFTDLFLLDEEHYSQLWRFLTAIFLHGDIPHLLYNLFALALFGSILETLIGGRRFLITFLITGVLANIISINFYPSSLGASGAIFGVIGALIVVRPMQVVWAFGLPMPILVAGVLWVIGDVIGVFVPSNVGNIAHLSGMFFGLVLGFLLRRKKQEIQIEDSVNLDEEQVRRWEDFYLKN